MRIFIDVYIKQIPRFSLQTQQEVSQLVIEEVILCACEDQN